jgi:hypothetical protein
MTLAFLKKVLPEGLVIIARPAATKGFVQVVCKSVEEAAEQAKKFDESGADTYFGLGSLLAPFVLETRNGKEVKAVRVGQNISQLKCLFLDLDVEQGHPKKYDTQADAVVALRQFCRDTNFPAPMIVSSGGGIHVYWPFDKPVAADQWRSVAQAFKAAIAEYGLKADPSRTSDASSVLRVVGTHNHKGGTKRAVELVKDADPYPRKQILAAVMSLVERYNVEIVAPAVRVSESPLGDNMKPTYEPSDINKAVALCAQLQELVRTGGEDEPLWRAGLTIARKSTEPYAAAVLLSKNYNDYDESELQAKLATLDAQDPDPYTCNWFKEKNPAGCEGCPHFGKVRSPIRLGEEVVRHIPLQVEIKKETLAGEVTVSKKEIPGYPFPFARNDKGQIVCKGKGDSGVEEDILVHEYDLKPLRRTYSERFGVESTTWQITQPIIGDVVFSVEQSMLAKPEGLHGLLLSKGVYTTPGRLKLMVTYMIAYIKELQKVEAADQLFSRVGWRNNNTEFVLGDTVYLADGSAHKHLLAPEILSELPGLRSAGTLEGWKNNMQFYNADGHEAHRFMLYTGFGAPLMHMTGHKGVIVNATGAPGAGKTTAISASTSIYGHPVDMLFNGTRNGSTVKAMYAMLAAYNNLPFGMDEITRIDPKVFGDFALTVNQGTLPIRLRQSGAIADSRGGWATIVQTSANTDVYITLGLSRADAAAEAVRVLQVPFKVPKSHTKTSADQFLRDLKLNHGLAGHVFMQYVVQNYDKVAAQIASVMAHIDSRAVITSAERFWSGAIAAAFVGALIARKLGLLDSFPIEADFEWVLALVASSRKSMVEHIASPTEVLSEFLDARVGETLVVSQTTKQTLPRVEQPPRGALCIRHETDTDRVYIMKSEFKRYCAETGANFGTIQEDLELLMILTDRNRQTVLGKGTDFGKGQVRCWEIDLKRLRRD